MTREEYLNLSEEERKRYDEENKKKGFVLANAAASHRKDRNEARENRKDETRKRIRNASAGNAVFIPAKKRPNAKDYDGERTVAVYARVSTNSEEQVSSMENQTRYYTEKIEDNPNWTMTKIYADEGKSGTSMKRRTEFCKMLDDAKEHKMDLILCASVSRFARNVTDCIEQIDMLKTYDPRHPVEVFFETEQISTLDPDATLNLQIHAILADWESANKSRRMILSYDQRICTGQYPVSDLLGYRHTKDGGLEIVEDEAITVRFIFLALMCGYTYSEVAEILTDHERKTLTGRTEWNGPMVKAITQNERRWGDLKARKTIVIDYKKGKIVPNTEIRDGAFVPQHHEGIVSPEIARAVHALELSGDRKEGVTEIGVIDIGGLKGFVNVNPYFGGVDRDTLLELSRSVYNDEEYAHMEHEQRIINGEEHSNILSMDFSGYYVPHSAYFIGRSTPTLTISRRQLKFNSRCHDKLKTNKVELLYHPLMQAVIVRECDENRGFQWNSEEDGLLQNISAAAFCSSVYEQQDWIAGYAFRFRGIYRNRGDQNMLIFFLDEPQIVSNKASKKAAEALSEEQRMMPSRYIPYKNSELLEEEAGSEEWAKRRFGRLYAMRKRRDDVIDGLSEVDIAERGLTVVNPLIGEIPSREEIAEELEELLLSM